MSYTIHYDGTPPSMNAMAVGGGAKWQKFHRVKGEWEGIWAMLLLVERLPKNLTSVRGTASLRFPSKRRRDEGNYRAFIEKTLGDALVKGGWIPDDTPEHFTFAEVTFEEEKGKARTTLSLEFAIREEG